MTSWITWKSATNPHFEELVEKATSPLNLPWPDSEDIALNLEICDLIRSKTVPAKPAMQSLKTRLSSKNGRVQMSAMGLIDTCIKNGGDHFLQEIASKEFVDEMTGVIKSPTTNPQVCELAIKMFQQWAIAFESKRELSYLPEVYRELKNQGISFPPPPTSIPSHLLTTATPPTWIDSDSCMRCRTAFTFTNRKHHCRNCGLVFDQACSSKTMALPALGIMEEVRVCEGCWSKAGKNVPTSKNDPNTPPVPSKRTPRSAQDLDADLQRAIALSLAESHPSHRRGYVPSEPMAGRKLEGSDAIGEEEDEELRMAIQASLAEMEKIRPTAPGEEEEPEYKPLPTYDLSTREAETLLTFAQTIDHAVGFGDQDLRRFPHAHALHDQAQMLSGKLARNIEEKGTKQQMLSEMQDRLMMAIKRYDALLTEQDVYARRQADEERARRQAASAQYGYRPYPAQAAGMTNMPQYGYAPQDPYHQANGYPQHAPPMTYGAIPYNAQQQPSQPTQAYSPPQPQSMYPSLPPGQPAPYSTDPYAEQQWRAPPERQMSVPTSPPPQRHIPQRQTSLTYTPQQAASPLREQAHLNEYAGQHQPSQGMSPPPQQAQLPQFHQPAIQPQAPAATSVQPSEQYQSYPSYAPQHPSAPTQALANPWSAQPQLFPAFPDAPTANLPEPQKQVENEQPKEALLIEL